MFIFRHKLEKRRAQCIAFCQQELSVNSESTSSSSSSSPSSSLSSRPSSNVSLGTPATQAPAFSDAVLLHYHPEKGRHGVRKGCLNRKERCFSKIHISFQLLSFIVLKVATRFILAGTPLLMENPLRGMPARLYLFQLYLKK